MNGVWEESLFFGAVVSLLAYEVGLMLKRRFRLAVLNPLLIAVICVIGVNAVMKVDYQTYNAGGQYLSYLLTPATVCLAVPLYEQLAAFESSLEGIGLALDTARAKYEEARKRLLSGNNNIVRTGERLRKLGLPTSKRQSKRLLDDADAADPDAMAPLADGLVSEAGPVSQPDSRPVPAADTEPDIGQGK